MSKKVITTIGPGSWDTYGLRFVESFQKFWPSEYAKLEVWHHHLGTDVPTYPGVEFKCLDDLPDFMRLATKLGPKATDGRSLQYAFKAIALAAAVTPDLEWIAFVDADTETMRPVDWPTILELFDAQYHLTYLYRKSVQESEGSWFAFNLMTVHGSSLLSDYCGLYSSLEFLHYTKQHDNAVLDRLVNIHKAHGLNVKNLSEGALGLDAFHQSILGAYMVHYKGPDKNTIADPGLGVPGRYQILCDLLVHSIKETGKANIVEIGTWNGSRAVQMAEAAFAAGVTEVIYRGFDTFDAGNDRTHEGHTKPHAGFEQVANRLKNYAELMRRKGKSFEFMLHPGNSLNTLDYVANMGFLKETTFAYIDGGHSYETVKSDYAYVKHIPYIVLDDVILDEEPGAPEGPIKVFKEITEPKQSYTTADGYLGLRQTITFGIVTKKGFKAPELRTNIKVQPVDSVPKTEQFDFIRENTAAAKEWMVPAQAHGRTALLVSAGPTLPDFLYDIKAKQAAGGVVFAVKHALPVLHKAGIVPDFVVILDPRPADEVSTHGILRTDLFQGVYPGDKVLMATMTHPSVRRVLEDKGARIISWHAHTKGTAEANLPELKLGMVLNGGTCSATRAPMLAYALGFRRMEFYGMDLFYPADTDPKSLKQGLMKIQIGENRKEFLTTGELIACAQDLGEWSKWLVGEKLSVKFHGDGAGSAIWESCVRNYQQPGEYPYA